MFWNVTRKHKIASVLFWLRSAGWARLIYIDSRVTSLRNGRARSGMRWGVGRSASDTRNRRMSHTPNEFFLFITPHTFRLRAIKSGSLARSLWHDRPTWSIHRHARFFLIKNMFLILVTVDGRRGQRATWPVWSCRRSIFPNGTRKFSDGRLSRYLSVQRLERTSRVSWSSRSGSEFTECRIEWRLIAAKW